ncbi:hypothetical protein EJ110_NYTH27477 [Nymphaea thermarum]|nr:hypothetical protein EJ110_NYTH27477 [Nymphaea thermarum]
MDSPFFRFDGASDHIKHEPRENGVILRHVSGENGCCAGRERSDPEEPAFSYRSTSAASPAGFGLSKEWVWLERCAYASMKGFAIGAGLKGGLAAFSILARIKRRSSSRKSVSMSDRDSVVIALKETLRYGLFLGTFAGTFVSVDESIAAFGGADRCANFIGLLPHSPLLFPSPPLSISLPFPFVLRTAGWRALVAGGVAGPSMLLTGLDSQHTSLAIYILMRAAVLASRCGIKSEKFGRICRPLAWAHGDIFLMCLSSSQILSAYILKQESLPSSYRSFLNKHGGKDPILLQGVKAIASGKALENLEKIEDHYKSIGLNVKLDPDMKVPCSIVHGNQSCAAHTITFLLQAYGRALPVYIPVYLIPALIVHRQGLLRRPYSLIGKSILGIARSSLFLSAYCASAWTWTCLLFRIFKRCNIPMVAIGTFPPGLALLIEKKSRRMEISLYCFARAIESFFTWMSDIGLVPPSKEIGRADVVLFSLSTAIIMHCYSQEREVFRSKYLNVLDWVFGIPSTYKKDTQVDANENKKSLTV